SRNSRARRTVSECRDRSDISRFSAPSIERAQGLDLATNLLMTQSDPFGLGVHVATSNDIGNHGDNVPNKGCGAVKGLCRDRSSGLAIRLDERALVGYAAVGELGNVIASRPQLAMNENCTATASGSAYHHAVKAVGIVT